MFKFRQCLWAVLVGLSLSPTTLLAADDPEIWDSRITQAWLDEHVAFAQKRTSARSSYALARTQVWTNGLARSHRPAFTVMPPDRIVGARLQPFRHRSLMIGTELARPGDAAGSVSSRISWETSWSRGWEKFGGLTLDLAAAGALGSHQTGYSQSVNGTLGFSLDGPLTEWTTEFRLSPGLNLDTSSGTVGTHLTSQIVSQTALGSRTGAFRSVLNLRLGYDMAPETRPAAFARMEISIKPNL
jgi:hypothetical protein